MDIGTKVLFRGQYSKTLTMGDDGYPVYAFPVRGVIELTRPPFIKGAKAYGVRLENGNFKWASEDKLKRQ